MKTLIFWGGQGWDNRTLFLYVAVSCLAGFLAFLSIFTRAERKSVALFAVSSLTLVLFKSFCVSGVDVRFGGGYYQNFNSALSLSSFRDKSVEIGFQIFTVIIRRISDSYEFYLFTVAVISVLPVMYVFWKFKDRINLPFAVLGYSLVFLVTGMSAMRQFIAVGICLPALYFYLVKHYNLAALYAMLAFSFHYSAACILLLLLFLLAKDKRVIQLIIAGVSVMFCIFAKSVIMALFTGRYSIYALPDATSFGLAAFLKYIPLFILLFAVESHLNDHCFSIEKNKVCVSYCWSILLFAFSMALIGYIIPIFGRAESYSLPVVLVCAYLIKQCEEERYFRLPVKCLVFCYFCFRLLLYMNDSYISEGLMPYLTWLA